MMTQLSDIVGSKIRAAIFQLLFTVPEIELHAREIERRTGFNDRAIRQELEKLRRIELVEQRRDGNRLYFRAKRDHPLFQEIRGLSIKTSGYIDVLKKRLQVRAIDAAFLFGSMAGGHEKAGSDIDLVVIGSLGLRDVSRLLRGAQEELGREINPNIYTLKEFQTRVDQRDHFLTSVLAGPRIMIKGDANELGRMGAQRMAATASIKPTRNSRPPRDSRSRPARRA